MKLLRIIVLVSLSLGCLTAPASAGDLGYRGWGPRFGVADDPDQVVGGLQFDFGEFAKDVRFIPNVELGVGDDHTIVAVTAPAHYVWSDLRSSAVPYAGAGLALGYVDRDNDGPGDDSEVEVAFKAIGGSEWRLQKGRSFFVELNLIVGDLHDVSIVAGWMFR